MKSSEVKSYTAILVALEGDAEAVLGLLREQGDHAVMQQALAEMRKPEHFAAMQAMVRGAIAGAASALNFDASKEPTPPAQPPIPDGWPGGWTLGQDTTGPRLRYMPSRIVPGGYQPTALRWDTPDEARRDAWERHEQEKKG